MTAWRWAVDPFGGRRFRPPSRRRSDGAGCDAAKGDSTISGQGSEVEPSSIERRLSAAAIGLALLGFGLFLVLLPPFFQSFDEAKYVGIGRNVLGGRGVVTIDGTRFLEHSPLWSVAIVAPTALFGGSPLDWGRFFDALAGLGLVALVGAFGWRIRPAVGALAAAVFVGFVYVHDLTRTARLDVPAAFLTLAAVGIGLRAFERRSARWSLAAGVAFGIAGLVKEIVLPFAPVPILAALLRGLPGRTIARLSGWMVLAALATTAWWFVVVAGYTGRVYRLGLPAWTLGPLFLGVAAGAVAAIAIDRFAGEQARPADAVGGSATIQVRRFALALGAAVAWFGLQLLFYAQSRDARLPNLANLAQLRVYAATWAPALGLVGAFGAGGLALLGARLLLERRSARLAPATRPLPTASPEWLSAAELVVALVCSAPLVLLVATLGEPPRNYLAQIGLGVALAAAGWIWLAEVVAGHGRAAWLGAGAVAGLAASLVLVAVRLSPAVAVPAGLVGGLVAGGVARLAFERLGVLRRTWPAVTAVAAAVLFVGALGVYATGHRESAGGRARAEVVDAVVAWVRSHLPPGSTVALGSLLGYEIGNELVGDYGVVRITQTSARVDPGAPLGIATPGGPGLDDWIAVDPAPRNTAELAAFRATTILDRLRRTGAVAWVYVVGTDTAAPTLLAALTPEHGFHEAAHVVALTAGSSPPIEGYVFTIDPDTLDLPTDRLYVAPEALERIVAGLRAAHPPPREVAARLLERIVVVPAEAGPQVEGLLAELRVIAGGSAGGR